MLTAQRKQTPEPGAERNEEAPSTAHVDQSQKKKQSGYGLLLGADGEDEDDEEDEEDDGGGDNAGNQAECDEAEVLTNRTS